MAVLFRYADPTCDGDYLVQGGSAGDTLFDGSEFVYAGRWKDHVVSVGSVDVVVTGNSVEGPFERKESLRNWKSQEAQWVCTCIIRSTVWAYVVCPAFPLGHLVTVGVCGEGSVFMGVENIKRDNLQFAQDQANYNALFVQNRKRAWKLGWHELQYRNVAGVGPTFHVTPFLFVSFQSSKNRTESGGRHRGEMLGLLNDQRPSGRDGCWMGPHYSGLNEEEGTRTFPKGRRLKTKGYTRSITVWEVVPFQYNFLIPLTSMLAAESPVLTNEVSTRPSETSEIDNQSIQAAHRSGAPKTTQKPTPITQMTTSRKSQIHISRIWGHLVRSFRLSPLTISGLIFKGILRETKFEWEQVHYRKSAPRRSTW